MDNDIALMKETLECINELSSIFEEYGICLNECFSDLDSCEEELSPELFKIIQSLSEVNFILEKNL